ncbi:MAG: hypothetical protein EOM80_08160 [Erysipelotrichia bacterium]|nr:hypothetical protein [Erysipelotrichia bacterium]
MHELYAIIADPENGEILTLLAIGLLSFFYLSFIWGNGKRLNNELTTFEWGQIYAFGLVVFLCLVIIFGKFFFAQNVDALLDLLGAGPILGYFTVRFQMIILAILRSMM